MSLFITAHYNSRRYRYIPRAEGLEMYYHYVDRDHAEIRHMLANLQKGVESKECNG